MRQGGLRDTILHSAGANAAHGLRRTNADKRRVVFMLLQDEEWAQWSDREIGRQCAVSHEFVRKLRPDLSTLTDAPRTVARGGTVYEMKPRGGAKPVEPEPSAPPWLSLSSSRRPVRPSRRFPSTRPRATWSAPAIGSASFKFRVQM